MRAVERFRKESMALAGRTLSLDAGAVDKKFPID